MAYLLRFRVEVSNDFSDVHDSGVFWSCCSCNFIYQCHPLLEIFLLGARHIYLSLARVLFMCVIFLLTCDVVTNLFFRTSEHTLSNQSPSQAFPTLLPNKHTPLLLLFFSVSTPNHATDHLCQVHRVGKVVLCVHIKSNAKFSTKKNRWRNGAICIRSRRTKMCFRKVLETGENTFRRDRTRTVGSRKHRQ